MHRISPNFKTTREAYEWLQTRNKTMSIEIGDYVEVKTENPYDSTVAALIAAYDTAVEADIATGGDGSTVAPKQVAITVAKEDVKKTKFKFSKAANDAERTARFRSATDSEDGTAVTLVFTLTNRHAARRHKGDSKKDATVNSTVDTAEVAA
jgi:hypothetical protein